MQESILMKSILPYVVCLSGALFFAYELVQMHMMNALSPMLMKDLSIGATQFGVLSSTYLLADVIFLLPAGIILDRFSTRKVILSALSVCILGTIGFAMATSFKFAAVCHFLSGIGNAFCFLSCIMLVSRWFSQEKHAFIIGLVVTIGMLGGVIAQSPLSMLAEMLTWRKALFVDAGVGVLILGLIYLFVRDSPEGAAAASSAEELPFWEGIKRSLLNLQNVCCGLYTSLMNMPLMIIGAIYGSLFLTQVHSIPLAKASFIISMICMGTIVGSPTFGYLSDKTGLRRPWMLFGGITSIATFLAIMFVQNSSESMLTLLFFLLGFFSSTQVIGYPTITESNPKELTGTSMGVAAVIIMGLPMFVGPLFGYLMDLNWAHTIVNNVPVYAASDFRTAFFLFPLGFFIALAALHFIKEPKRAPIPT